MDSSEVTISETSLILDSKNENKITLIRIEV